ncbi:MAG TPA: hypothetical protein PK906_06620 [Spirochaetota bacterium]|nr:hypothetical protein [Spirochaetota bacterium]
MKIAGRSLQIIIAILLTATSAYPISVAERSSKDYYYTTKILRELKPMIANFKNDSNQKMMESITKNYEDASLQYYGQNFDDSSAKFYNLKLEIMKLMEELSALYLTRTNELLKSTIEDNKSIEIFLELDRRNGYASYFNKPFDPLKDVMPYDEKFTAKDYHFYFDASKIERYLKNGFYYYHEAKRVHEGEDIKFIKSRKRIKTGNIDYVINKYMNVIIMCRIAKESALEIYRVKNQHNAGNILDKYQIRKDQLTPIFDDRIPEKFKVDAVDNVKLLYTVELARRKKTMEKLGLKDS